VGNKKSHATADVMFSVEQDKENRSF
jgi:hypothetical protein